MNLFLLLLFFLLMTKFINKFPFHQKFLKMNHACLKEVITQSHNDLYYNEIVI